MYLRSDTLYTEQTERSGLDKSGDQPGIESWWLGVYLAILVQPAAKVRCCTGWPRPEPELWATEPGSGGILDDSVRGLCQEYVPPGLGAFNWENC